VHTPAGSSEFFSGIKSRTFPLRPVDRNMLVSVLDLDNDAHFRVQTLGTSGEEAPQTLALAEAAAHNGDAPYTETPCVVVFVSL